MVGQVSLGLSGEMENGATPDQFILAEDSSGMLAVVLGTAGTMASAWKELAGSLRWLSRPVQRAGTLREARASKSASSTRMLDSSSAGVSLARVISGGARKSTGM